MHTILLTAEEMRSAERASSVPEPVLMERAGEAVAAFIRVRWAARSVAVLCGKGNNGGDGRVVARLLAEAGWPVTLVEAPPLPPAALIVDALFGIGLKRPPEGALATLITEANASGAPIVAVDIPSGVFADTGEAPGEAIRAAATVTFGCAKPGLYLLPGRAHAGEITVADIGIPAPPSLCALNGPTLWRLPKPGLETHKYTRGHVLVLGGAESPGAAKLAALAALRAGAGLVTIGWPDEARDPGVLALMSRVLGDAEEVARYIRERRVSALVIGPGGGTDAASGARMASALAIGLPAVVDADAFSSPAALASLHPACVLTPHEGEFRRAFAHTGDKLTRARAAAAQTGAVMLLKGADTVIAAPDGYAAINANAPPWLATAGAGDVLCGLIAGLMAQGMPPFDAACAGAWLHGEAAQLGGRGLIADDLPGLLPRVIPG